MPPLQNPGSFSAPPSPGGQTPYDFFMDASSPKSSMSQVKKILLAIGIAVAVLAILAIVVAVFAGGKKTPQLISVAQSQQEIARVAADGSKNAQSPSLKNFSVTASASLISANQDLLAYMDKANVVIPKGALGAGNNTRTDKALASALTSSTYDVTYSSIMQSELAAYQNKLQKATELAASRMEQQMLQKYSAGAEILRAQLLAQ